MNVLVVIPARAGSARVRDKNLQALDQSGRDLIALAVDVAKEVTPHVIVSSDYPTERLPGRAFHLRGPDDLYGPQSDIAAVTSHALANREDLGDRYDYVVTLQPATPLRSDQLLREMLDTMHRARCVSALTMARCVPWTWNVNRGRATNAWTPDPYPRSQAVRFHNLQEINTVQISTPEIVRRGERWGTPLLITELPHWAVLDIDTPADLEETRDLWPALSARLGKLRGFPFHVTHTVNGEDVGGAA